MRKMLHPLHTGMYQLLGYIINGFVLVINNGFILNYGAAVPDTTVTYCISFTHTPRITIGLIGSGSNPGHHIYSTSLTGFKSGNSNGWTFHWIATGY